MITAKTFLIRKIKKGKEKISGKTIKINIRWQKIEWKAKIQNLHVPLIAKKASRKLIFVERDGVLYLYLAAKGRTSSSKCGFQANGGQAVSVVEFGTWRPTIGWIGYEANGMGLEAARCASSLCGPVDLSNKKVFEFERAF